MSQPPPARPNNQQPNPEPIWTKLNTWRKARPREAWGYAVWGLVGAAVALPEIWAAADAHGVPWPTISGTVGHIENAHDWTALIVIAVLIWAAFYAIRVNFTSAPKLEPGETASDTARQQHRVFRTVGGRLTLSARPRPLPAWRGWDLYFPLAAAIVVAASIATGRSHPDDRWLLGQVLYGLDGLTLFAIPGLLAYKLGRLVPFPTLFRTIQLLEARTRTIAVILAAGMAILMIHLVFYPWPSIIPDVQRLHDTYRCHPSPPKKPPTNCAKNNPPKTLTPSSP